MHNLSTAKSTGLCLAAFIDPRCFEGMLELHRDGVIERKIILRLRSRRLRCSKIALRFRYFCI